jgi:hypothetical protein
MTAQAAASAARELRALADRVPTGLARQRAAGAAEAVAAALDADPTLAERQQRGLDVLAELLRRLTPLARQAVRELERQRLAADGKDTAHLGRANPRAAEELGAVSERCTALAATITAAVLPDWDSPRRIRELSASRMPRPHELAEIAGQLRRAVGGRPGPALPGPGSHPARGARRADSPAAGG